MSLPGKAPAFPGQMEERVTRYLQGASPIGQP